MIRSCLLTVLILAGSLAGYSQVKAVTENGDEVLLYKDGTWKAANITPSYDTRLDTPVLTKSDKATFLVKGKKVNYGVYIDPKKWTFKPEKDESSPVEYMFELKGEDSYCMVIPEKVELTLDLLQKAALMNGKSIAPDIHVTREETRKINGNIVKCLELHGTVEGIKFVYFGYYYTGSIGTIQLVSYTVENLFAQNKKEMETFLNGLTVIK